MTLTKKSNSSKVFFTILKLITMVYCRMKILKRLKDKNNIFVVENAKIVYVIIIERDRKENKCAE